MVVYLVAKNIPISEVLFYTETKINMDSDDAHQVEKKCLTVSKKAVEIVESLLAEGRFSEPDSAHSIIINEHTEIAVEFSSFQCYKGDDCQFDREELKLSLSNQLALHLEKPLCSLDFYLHSPPTFTILDDCTTRIRLYQDQRTKEITSVRLICSYRDKQKAAFWPNLASKEELVVIMRFDDLLKNTDLSVFLGELLAKNQGQVAKIVYKNLQRYGGGSWTVWRHAQAINPISGDIMPFVLTTDDFLNLSLQKTNHLSIPSSTFFGPADLSNFFCSYMAPGKTPDLHCLFNMLQNRFFESEKSCLLLNQPVNRLVVEVEGRGEVFNQEYLSLLKQVSLHFLQEYDLFPLPKIERNFSPAPLNFSRV